MIKKYALVIAAMVPLISFGLGTGPAKALMMEMGTPELTHQAEAIIRGTVKDMKSERDADGKHIWTLVTIAVSKSIKGKNLANQEVMVKIPGGVVGTIAQKTEDTPIFKKGEDVFLFLKPEVYKGEQVFRVVGKFQGKHTIKNDMLIEKKMPVKTFLNQVEKEK
jgi:hypothetical protein